MLLEGIFAALPTPFFPDGQLYPRKLEANVERLARSLLAGIAVLGQASETGSLNDAESLESLRVAAQAAAPEKLLIAGLAGKALKPALERAEAAAALGYDAVLAPAPSAMDQPLTPAEIETYFLALADRSPLPVILLSEVQGSAAALGIEVIARLAGHPNLIGLVDRQAAPQRTAALAEASHNAPWRTVQVSQQQQALTRRSRQKDLAQIAHSRNVGFQLLAGSAVTLLDSLQAGASGALLPFASCAPQACLDLYLNWKEHDLPAASLAQQRIALPAQRIEQELGVAALKHACDFNGFYGGNPRLPLLPLTDKARQEVVELLAKIRC